MQRFFRAALIVSAVLAPNIAAAVDLTWPPDTIPPQINLTSESATGWRPSAAQLAGIRETATGYLGASDDGRVADAYGLMTEDNRQRQPLPAFGDAALKFNQLAGPAKERRIVKVTWTKDPAQAPAPGVYAALDVVGRFANVDRYGGYLIRYQAPSGGAFQVMREEKTFLDNATAQKIEQQRPRADVDRVWSQISAHCPNYAAGPAPLPEQAGSSVGYPTVDDALRGLHAKPGVEFASQGGWTIAIDRAEQTMWSLSRRVTLPIRPSSNVRWS